MKKREKMELTGETIAPIVASVAAGVTFWWLATYSTICERDIVGTTITVWCAVVAKVLIWTEKKGAIKE